MIGEGSRVSFIRHMIGMEAPPFYPSSMGVTTDTEESEGSRMKAFYRMSIQGIRVRWLLEKMAKAEAAAAGEAPVRRPRAAVAGS